MRKHLKILIPVVLVLVTVLGGVIVITAGQRLTVAVSDGTQAVRGAFSLEKTKTADFNVFENGTEIAPGSTTHTVVWSSSDEAVLSVDPATGVAVADKDGNMPGPNGRAMLTVTVTENASGNVKTRSYTVNVSQGAKEIITVVSGVNEGIPLEIGTEYTLISRTYDRKGNDLTMAANQLFCTYSCDRLEINGGKFTPVEPGVLRIVAVGYATEADQAKAQNEVTRDVLEVYVFGVPTPTPSPTPTPTPEPTPTPTPTPEPTPTPTPEPTPTLTPMPEPTETPAPEPTQEPDISPELSPTADPEPTGDAGT